jgi:hypothetical protein
MPGIRNDHCNEDRILLSQIKGTYRRVFAKLVVVECRRFINMNGILCTEVVEQEKDRLHIQRELATLHPFTSFLKKEQTQKV